MTAFDYVNVGNPHTKPDFIIKIKPTSTNEEILNLDEFYAGRSQRRHVVISKL